MEKWRAVVYLGGNSDLETIEFCDKLKRKIQIQYLEKLIDDDANFQNWKQH